MRLTTLILIAFLLSSCGMTGPLYLPSKGNSHAGQTHHLAIA